MDFLPLVAITISSTLGITGLIFLFSVFICTQIGQAQSKRLGYKEVVLKGDTKKLNLHGQTCAVCLEDLKVKDELGILPCQHAFHRRCVVKWLELWCDCPMCNKALCSSTTA